MYRPLFLILASFFSCKESVKLQAYKLEMIRDSYSLIGDKIERETKIDTFYAVNDTAAFDSVCLNIYAQQYAQQVVKDIYTKQGKADQYPFVEQKLISLAAYNDRGIDVSLLLSDSVKKIKYEYYKAVPIKK